MNQTPPATSPATLKHTAEIVAAFVARNRVAASEIAEVIRSIHSTLTMLARNSEIEAVALKPAVPVKKSVTSEYVICLEDGRKLKMLKRYLRSRYNLTPEQYRAKWNLPVDYPLVAPSYAARRSAFAKQIGLGKKSKGSKARTKGR
jgi:predicted transcriptional regulator